MTAMNKKRIRKEIRDLSPVEWSKVVRAMWIMKNTANIPGKKLYGNRFTQYDELLMQHISAALDPRGDHGHFGPVFGLFHRAWLLKFENSLLAIDPSIKGMPYWDFARDMTPLSQHYPSAFSAKYFGSRIGQASDYAVVDGPFAKWTVPKNTNGHSNIHTNPFGYIRHPLNPNKSPYFTRKGGTICGTQFGLGDPTMWDVCLQAGDKILDWNACIDAYIHGPAHSSIAGSWRQTGQKTDSLQCAQWFGFIAAPQSPLTFSSKNSPYQLGTFIHPYALGCFSCPKCTQDKDPKDCMCQPKNPCGPLFSNLRTLPTSNPTNPGTKPSSGTPLLRTSSSAYKINLVSADQIQILGDFGDPAGAPNDPM